MGDVLLGCSGWSYKDWVGPFYKAEKESKLRAYSRVFWTAEINSTFYAYPSKGTVMGWLKYTKLEFVCAAKLPKLITHKKRLDLGLGVEADVERFYELMEPLWLYRATERPMGREMWVDAKLNIGSENRSVGDET